MNEVTCICFRMFLKTEVVAEEVGNELKAIDCEKSENWLPSNNMEIGSGMKWLVSGLPDDKQKTLRLEFRKSLKLMAKIHERTSSVNKRSSTRFAVFASIVQERRGRPGSYCQAV